MAWTREKAAAMNEAHRKAQDAGSAVVWAKVDGRSKETIERLERESKAARAELDRRMRA